MRIYLDDDSIENALIKMLRRAGHEVLIPAQFNLAAAKDPVHLRRAIREKAVFLSHNYHDFEILHDLLLEGQGHHPGILIVRRDNDPNRDLKASGIVRAIRNLEAAGMTTADQYIFLNQWR